MEIQEGKPQGVFGSLSNRAPVCGCAAPLCTMLTIAPARRHAPWRYAAATLGAMA